jgi:hypothetical protein
MVPYLIALLLSLVPLTGTIPSRLFAVKLDGKILLEAT